MTLLSSTDYADLAKAYAGADRPGLVFEAIAALLSKRMGFSLLTMLRLEPDGDAVTRIYTTDERHYPVTGTEALGSTAWGQQVLRQGRPFLGPDKASVRWAFPADYDLIESLGLGSTMNIPVTMPGRVLGTMNILDREHAYSDDHFAAACSLAPFLVSAFLVAGGAPDAHTNDGFSVRLLRN